MGNGERKWENGGEISGEMKGGGGVGNGGEWWGKGERKWGNDGEIGRGNGMMGKWGKEMGNDG